jgi:hypothetical protein
MLVVALVKVSARHVLPQNGFFFPAVIPVADV